MSDAASSPSPQRLGPYELRAKIAEGGMASVYAAKRDGALFAVKMIREDFTRHAEFLDMFLDEAKIALLLRHPNVVTVHELGSDQGHAFIAMELLAGQSLQAVWDACRARQVRLRYDVIAWIGARAADGLHYAHELVDELGRPLDIVHRDVNPSNIFLTYDGQVKIIDFGLAKAANRASKTAAGVIKGKVAYMSPEQAVGDELDRRTDVFALGTTLWELACDQRLFKSEDDVRTLERVHAARVTDPRALVAGFPAGLAAVLMRALARDRGERYATAAEMARALDAFVGTAVDARVLGEVVRSLFPDESARRAAWLSGPPPPMDLPPPGAGPSAARRALPVVMVIVAVVGAVVAGAVMLR